jgi:hypothetical protein
LFELFIPISNYELQNTIALAFVVLYLLVNSIFTIAILCIPQKQPPFSVPLSF